MPQKSGFRAKTKPCLGKTGLKISLLPSSYIYYIYSTDPSNGVITIENVTHVLLLCRFTTLVSALTTAGLMKTVSGNRAVTLFAPTNDAFDEVNDLTTLLANKKDIRAVSYYL